MRRVLPLIAVFLVASCAPGPVARPGDGDAAPASPQPGKLVGKTLPVLTATQWKNTPGDRPYTWDDLKGKVVLVDLWAYW